jgi:beta-glucosidase
VTRRFPDGFLWGAATSAFQVEGALEIDGRGPSVWDAFPSEAGETGAVACDSYRRWEQDVALAAELGLGAYRFSIAWPRIHPAGDGRVEQRGLDHYARMIDALLARGIVPVVTLHHWDLPLGLDWSSRVAAERFAEFACTCFDAYGDRVGWWLTVNEPWIVGVLGHLLGLHAPGRRDPRAAAASFHHLLLGHGLAVQARPATGRIGIALNLFPHYPASERPADVAAAWASDGYCNRWFLDALYHGAYPEDMRSRWEALIGPLDFVHDGDLELIATPTDFLGVNYYAPRVIEAVPGDEPWPWRVVVPDSVATTGGFTGGVAHTEAGTPIVPAGLSDLLVRLRDDYAPRAIMITENGAVFGEPLHDAQRVAFIDGHLRALHAAMGLGVPVVGYCHWSLLDNFEWRLGYGQRFGLVHVDYATQERTIKDSGRWFARVAKENAL